MRGHRSLAVVAIAAAGCGANIQAVYEGDVRFEHCMGLDAEPTVKSVIRRACWVEWLAFYTYGQTRDRVQHAQRRVSELDVEPGPRAAGEPEMAAAVPPPAPDGERARLCADDCRAAHQDCTADCATPSCRVSCLVNFRSCVRRCS